MRLVGWRKGVPVALVMRWPGNAQPEFIWHDGARLGVLQELWLALTLMDLSNTYFL